ncbi:hypothetical protein PN499_26595 [Kamptonema animale CS-326]|jgi:hypothetical protein|uniref:hypothetical protein n=1 Tax=Kamptonema animale TaxID=92934 RepID=UPI00232F813A|nr:hypothetical protein [Kamptonema animale]MDB9514777.1 hypothetical protein [Kamptonema animale CS-326]
MATIITTKRPSLTPKEFRQLTGWSVYKMARESEIPLPSLYNYLKEPEDPAYREPKPFINRMFGLMYESINR